MKNNMALTALGSTALLFGALLGMEDGYYQFLRLAICASALFFVWVAYREQRHGLILPLAVTALLFNPFMPLDFEESTWAPIDVCAGLLFAGIGVQRLGWTPKLGVLSGRKPLIVAAILALVGAGTLWAVSANRNRGFNPESITVTETDTSMTMDDPATIDKGDEAIVRFAEKIRARDDRAQRAKGE